MNFIERAIFDRFKESVLPNKVLMLLGARRVGKTALIGKYLETVPKSTYLKLNGEDIQDVQLLEERSLSNYEQLLSKVSLLVIDEAQKIPEIGLKLKLIVDHIDHIKVVVTGSSVFDLTGNLGEPLVGRKNTLYLYPLAQSEFATIENRSQSIKNLEQRLLFGGYPELEQYKDWKDKRTYLNEIVNGYLLRDILTFEGLKKADKIYNLLRLIAFQVGKEVSIQELGRQLGLAKNTVDRYLDLLSKVFVIFKVNGFSRNLRKEVVKSSRWYFYDNGIRNAIVGNFNTITNRNDIGDLWENYLAVERLKSNVYKGKFVNNYFWRTYDQQELDWVEEENGVLSAYEFKWNPKRKSTAPKAWSSNYPEASFQIIDKTNYLDFIS